jgi:putative restriction endonuclease
MTWLDQRREELLTSVDLANFHFRGERVPLMDRQRGIRKPAVLDAALSFRTTYTAPGKIPPYVDQEGADGFLRYKYRGEDPEHPENVAMRRCFQDRLPVIWFVGIDSGRYLARFPVYLVADEPEQLQFAVAIDPEQRYLPRGSDADEDSRRYVERLTKLRLHQPVFRARVLQAYERQCTICRLKHVNLLDAAHILPDVHPLGQPVVPNGLAMCKIHHAAFDQNIIGIRPDLIVEIRRDILEEVDGPMLKHGLQEMAGTRLTAPRTFNTRPAKENLEERYETFKTAS